jgi:hypothetical protein
VVDLVHELVELLQAVGTADYIIVGGLAVRFLVGEASARQTRDIDIVAMNAVARDRLLGHLRAMGYRIGATGGWHRAALPRGPSEAIIDVASHPVVNPRTFEELTLRGAPVAHKVEGMTVQVVAPDDLALLKLAAHRDQDVIDLLLLSGRLSAKAVAAGAEKDDVERSAAEGAQVSRLLIASQEFAELTEELLGRKATSGELQSFEAFLSDLQKEGL